jgi:hypothetical protein
MKHTALTVLTLAILFFGCSKNSPDSVAPPNGPGNGTPRDTTPAPPKHDTTPTPPKETPGKTLVTSTFDWYVLFYHPFVMLSDGYGTYFRVQEDDTSHYSVEILNLDKGICQISLGNDADSEVVYHFSNFYHYTTKEEAANPDSAGKVQFHAYRKDGRNIKPGVKDIYMVLTTAPANIAGQGTIMIRSYPGNRRNLNVDSLVSIIARYSDMTLVNSDGF